MFHRPYISAAAILAAMISMPALASPAVLAVPFATPAVSDQLLGQITGTASPYTPLSRSNLVRFAEGQSRDDARLFGSITILQMDAWWGTIGSELIASAVRKQP